MLPVTTGLVAHLDPSTLVANDGDRVTSAPAAGGATAWTAQGVGPIYRVSGHNGRPFLEQHATGATGLRWAGNLASGDSTVFVVARQRGTASNRIFAGISNNWLLGWHNPNEDDHFAEGWVHDSSAVVTTNVLIYSARRTSGVNAFRRGKTLLASNTLGTQGPNGITTNGYVPGNSQYSDADVYEVITYDRALSDAEVEQVNSYLYARYTVPIVVESFEVAPTTFSYGDGGDGTWTSTSTDGAHHGTNHYRNSNQAGSHQKRWGSWVINESAASLTISVRRNGILNPWSNGNTNDDPCEVMFRLYDETAGAWASPELHVTKADMGTGASVGPWVRKSINSYTLTPGRTYSLYNIVYGWDGRRLIDVDWAVVGSPINTPPTITLASPAADAIVKGDPDLTVAVTDPDTETVTVEYEMFDSGTDYASEVLADSPAGYWRLGETSGTTAVDTSGNAHSGTYVGTFSRAVDGAFPGDLAASFEGGTIPTGKTASQLGVGGAAPRTTEAWVYTRSFTTAGIWEMGAHVAQQDWSLRTLATPNRWRVQLWADDLDFTYSSLKQWVHFVLVYEGSAGAVIVYADGTEIGRMTPAATLATADTKDFEIGRWHTSVFDGVIDEVAIYSTALSPARILAHYQAGAPSFSHQATAVAPVSNESVVWTPVGLPRGDYSWRVRGTDSLQPSAWTAPRSILLQAVPAITMVSPADTATVNSSTPVLTVQVTDPDVGLLDVEFQLFSESDDIYIDTYSDIY